MSKILCFRKPAALIIMSILCISTAFADDSGKRPAVPKNLPPGPVVNVTGVYIGPPDPKDIHAGMLNIPGTVGATSGRSIARAQAPLFLPNRSGVSNTPCDGSDPSSSANDQGRPIQLNTGAKFENYPLFELPGEMGLAYILYYNTSIKGGPWVSNLDYDLNLTCDYLGDPSRCAKVKYDRPDGTSLIFDGPLTTGPFTEEGGSGLATLEFNSSTNTYTLRDEDGTIKKFGLNAQTMYGYLESIVDLSGVGWAITSASANGVTTSTITHTNGQSFTVASGPVTSQVINGQTVTDIPSKITDPAGNVYELDAGPAVYNSITFPGSPTTVVTFKYVSAIVPRLSEVAYNGVPYDYTTYITTTSDPHYGWVSSNYLADNSEGIYLSYSADSSGNLQTIATNSLGHHQTLNYGGTNGAGGAKNGYLSLISDDAVVTCVGTVHGRSYDANGHLSEAIDNNGNAHTYTYAVNGQLQSETEAYGTPIARTTDYIWDPNQQLNRLLSVTVEGWSKTSYSYNDTNRLASVSVTNLSGSGTANQTLTTTYGYVLYGNSMVKTMTVTHPSPGGSDVDTYQYDTFGNLASLSNGLGQTTTYSNYNGLGEVGQVVGANGDVTAYTYDARGRVVTKTTHPNGAAATWTYAYDGFGLLQSITGPDGQVTTWNRDATMRVQSITHNDKDGTSTESFSYDANGDVTEHKVMRGSTVGLDDVLRYDALGRVYQKLGQHGQSLTYAYDGNGNVASITDAVGHTVSYQYDALDRVVKTSESGGASPPLPSPAPTINAPSTSSTGAYTVSWNSISNATGYELQEQINGGGWATADNGSTLTWSASGKPNGTYGYRVHGCNVSGCSPWSGTGTVTVLYPPATPTLSVPASNNTGSYTVSWGSVSTASNYTLQEQVNGGSWTTVQTGPDITWNTTGKANDTYSYRVEACNASGCSAWTPVGSVVVLLPPASAPTLSTPSSNNSGAYTVSWTSVPTATSYNLQEEIGSGSWTTVQSTAATTWGASGKSNDTYNYRVEACNDGGCSTWSTSAATTVLLPPGSPPSVSAPSSNSSGSYAISWSAIPDATSFVLQEEVNGGSWATVQSSAATSWSASGKVNGTYGYQVQSCNSGGCSTWSATATTTVLHPPANPPTLTVPGNSTTGGFTVSWISVATAITYTLQERLNGGAWSTVQSNGSTSWSVAGHGNGTYDYQVEACNASGCSPWSAIAPITVLLPPGAAPSISVPGSSTTGSYSVSWSGVATATSYTLQEQVDGGGWSTVQSSGATNWSTNGRGNATYGYHVQACNSSGCGPWSAIGNVVILHPPASAPSLSVAARNYGSSYTVNWGAVATATSYTLVERVNGGAWNTVQSSGATSWNAGNHGEATYDYQVEACNTSGCSSWSSVASTIVVIPTPIAANGQTYDAALALASGSGYQGIGFDIVNGNTWEVYKTTPSNAHVVMASGALPPGSSKVQFTWTDAGVPAGESNAFGSIVSNGASSPVSVANNPSTQYNTGTFTYRQGDHGHQYQFKVDFFDTAGVNVSSSTCLLIAEVVGNL